ncbi:hypothetical protein [Serratia fonticola]
MAKTARLLMISIISLIPMTSFASECPSQDKDEKFYCEVLRDSSKNIKTAHAEAEKVTGNNSSLKSIDELYGLQMKNCKNYKCKSNVSSAYYGVISNIPGSKVVSGGGKLSLEEACDATTKMRYFAALSAFSPASSARAAEHQSREFGKMVQIDDVEPYIKAYLEPSSNEFKQAYLEGDAAFQSMFVSMFGSCMSNPYRYLQTASALVRNDMLDMGSLIAVYKKAAR